MNILYFLREYPKISESFVSHEIDTLSRRDHNVAIFAISNPHEEIRNNRINDSNIPIGYFGSCSIPETVELVSPIILNSRVLSQCLYATHPREYIWRLMIARRCIDFIETLAWIPDHIHGHFALQDKFAAGYVATYYGIPNTLTAHAVDIFANRRTERLRRIFDRTNRLIVPSEYNRSYLRERFGQRLHIDVVPATTRVSKFHPSPGDEPMRLLTIARLVEKKGIDYAIRSVALLKETYPDIRYHIIGTGGNEQELRARAAELDVEDAIIFLGQVSDERLIHELDEAAIFVLPCVIATDGDRDSSPVALKEAMAMATPCVSTTLAGVPEIVEDRVSGLLVQPRNSEALAQAIGKLLADSDLRAEYGNRGRGIVESKFSMDTAVTKLLESFETAGASC